MTPPNSETRLAMMASNEHTKTLVQTNYSGVVVPNDGAMPIESLLHYQLRILHCAANSYAKDETTPLDSMFQWCNALLSTWLPAKL